MATWQTYDQVGIKEDVSDVIHNISPTKVPFQSSLQTFKVKNRLFEWQEDSLANQQDNAQLEGFDATEADLTATTLRSNRTQIFEKTIKVSGTADAVVTHGRDDETGLQLSKAAAEVKRDLEHTLVGLDQAAVVGDSTSTPRRMASYYTQIATETSSTNAGDRALSESLVLTVNQAIYDEGGEASILMIKPADALIVSDFAMKANTGDSGSRVRDMGTSKTVVNVVDFYVSPFGTQKVVLNRFIKAPASGEAILYDPENWRLCVLRPWHREQLAKDGDNEKHMLVGEFSLKHVNQKASGKISDLQ